ncbi:hypothetical protein QJQ45_004932 [Haematococcus lacustris]|nr:hypothetical protein QJQ45_004932 [Haematococcus lacustris]
MLKQLDEGHVRGDNNSLNANATNIITSIQDFYRHPGRFIRWWCKAVGVVEEGFTQVALATQQCAACKFWNTAKLSHNDLLMRVIQADVELAQFQLAAKELLGGEFTLSPDMVLGTKAMEVKWL